MTIPAWLTASNSDKLPAVRNRPWRADYLEKTLGDIQEIMAEDMYQAALAARQGFFQRLNPQVKFAGAALFILSVLVSGSLPLILVVHCLLVLLALASGIGLAAYLVRTWLPAAVFGGIVLVPGMFSWITPGEPLLMIYQGVVHLGPLALPPMLAITKQGVLAAVFVMLRSAASLGFVVLLVKTTRWTILTKALGRFGIPSIFIMVLDLTYRYLFLFLLLLTDFLLGRRSRLVGVEREGAKLAWIGSALAGFLRLLGEYNREITAAMVARGYSGENHQIISSKVGLADVIFLGFAILILAAVLGGAQIDHILGV